jgi:S-adenosylmethionine:tRNA ribosyltransferase-isomerase
MFRCEQKWMQMTSKKDYFYILPEELIAQHPLEKRDSSRLLVLKPANSDGAIKHTVFNKLSDYIRPGDCLVLNNTRVLPARLLGQKRDSKLSVEFLLLRRVEKDDWEVMVRPGRRLQKGHIVDFIPERLEAEILEFMPGGNRLVRFSYKGIWENVLEEAGTMPLPPYIHEKLNDRERYQTVYASQDGSAAAPTAGLHFTPELIKELQDNGVFIAQLTLHVGPGTFRPVKTDDISDHVMHSEYYELPESAVQAIEMSRKLGGRIIAVGTTSCRVLESVATEHDGYLKAQKGWTDIFIYPGYEFKVISGLVTNFHLPESTLLMLVSAFAGRTLVLQAYQEAIDNKYRFFSFGDAMLIIK